MYQIKIRNRALKKLRNLSPKDQVALSEYIGILSFNPDNKELDIKKLTGRPEYRMRVGNWRVLYLRDDKVKIIDIEKIGPRGDAYK